ncbi:MAG: helical backbone metal receptor [Brumimicrobium sp.]|nr:helical backbone metal receptor [Brumimicrobium sp.]
MEFTDQLGKTIRLAETPQRIVSLVPSQTELLYDLGLSDRVIGITKFCVHPDSWFRSKIRVGGTKNVDTKKAAELHPDLIIGNKEENSKSDIEALEEIAPVWMSDIYDLSDSLDMISRLGVICGVPERSADICNKISLEFEGLTPYHESLKVLYLIWRDPYMAAAGNTFIDSVITRNLGFENFLATEYRYPVIDPYDIEENPDLIFLSSEPYPFKEKHVEELKMLFPESRVYLVDGEYFSWYGSRLMKAPQYFRNLLDEIRKDNSEF